MEICFSNKVEDASHLIRGMVRGSLNFKSLQALCRWGRLLSFPLLLGLMMLRSLGELQPWDMLSFISAHRGSRCCLVKHASLVLLQYWNAQSVSFTCDPCVVVRRLCSIGWGERRVWKVSGMSASSLSWLHCFKLANCWYVLL